MNIIKTVAVSWVILLITLTSVDIYESEKGGYNVFIGNYGYHVEAR